MKKSKQLHQKQRKVITAHYFFIESSTKSKSRRDGASQSHENKMEEKKRTEQMQPRVLDIKDVRFTYISCGKAHAIAITEDGTPYCWGRNQEGQLGIIGAMQIDTPQKMTAMEGRFITMSACGDNHSLILTRFGEVFSFGQDESGKLGRTQMSEGESLTELKREFQPRMIPVNKYAIKII